MKKSRMLYPLLLLCSCFLSVSLFGAVEGDIHRTFKIGYGGTLRIDADLGSIEILAGIRQDVDVEIIFEKKRGSTRRFKEILSRIDVAFDEREDMLDISLDNRKERLNFWNSAGSYVRVLFRIKVPNEFNVDLRTSGGTVKIDDLTGRVSAVTSGGSLKFGTIQGPLYGKTSGGSIALESCQGDVDIHTSGGSISLGHITGDVRAATSGGSITINDILGSVEAKTSGGSITAAITGQPERNCMLKTSGGTIRVALEKDVAVNLDAATSGGRVHTEMPLTVRGSVSGRSLQGKINKGGPELYLRTSGGSIYINEM